jgi:putative ABC transport system permease protein
MFDLAHEILQSLRTNKLRTALTGLAVVWGIFMLVVLLSLSTGLTNAANYNFSRWATSSMSVWGGSTDKAYKGYKEGRWIGLKVSDLEILEKENPHNVESAISQIDIDSAQMSTQRDYSSDAVSGVTADFQKVADVTMLYGRYISDRDNDEQRKVVVMSEKTAKSLFGDAQAAVGQRARALGLSWLVVGVYTAEWENTNYIPFTTARAISKGNDKINRIRIIGKGLATEADGERLEQDVRNTLAAAHEFDPADTKALGIWNTFSNSLTAKKGMGMLTIATWVIGLLTMLSGIIGVSNIMFVSVKERTHEIGIRRAIGAKPCNIMMQVIAESVSITTIFGYIGIVLGVVVTEIIANMMGDTEAIRDPRISLTIAFEVTAVLIVAGAFAGLFPAIKATKVKPVEALRDE